MDYSELSYGYESDILLVGGEKMKVLKNYKSMIILIGAIILGGLVGLLWGEGAQVLSPFGDF